MSIFLILSIYIGLSVALIYTLLCGDSDYHRDGLVGSLYRFLTHGLCQCIKKGCSKMCGERLIRKFGAVEHYCCNTPNPILQIVYLVLVIGGYYLFLKDAAPLIPNSYVPGYHNYAVTIFMLLVLGVFFACYFVDAGSVTRNNVEVHMKSYPYDYLVYSKKTCTTCNITRPARSKHCAICNRCVARFDHHCPWINNCVAEYNQAYFLAFLWGTATLCLYGCYLCTMTLWAVVDERGMLTLQAKDKQGKLYPVSNIVLFQYIVQNTGMLFPLALFCIIISLVLYGFFLYHVYLVVKNTTTNESFKWSDLRRTQKRCKEYKRDYEEYMKTVQETTSDSPQDSNNTLARMESPMKRKPPQPDEKGGPFTKFNIEEIEAMCNKELTNIYNKGILHNFMEVLFPMSKRHKHSKRQ